MTEKVLIGRVWPVGAAIRATAIFTAESEADLWIDEIFHLIEVQLIIQLDPGTQNSMVTIDTVNGDEAWKEDNQEVEVTQATTEVAAVETCEATMEEAGAIKEAIPA